MTIAGPARLSLTFPPLDSLVDDLQVRVINLLPLTCLLVLYSWTSSELSVGLVSRSMRGRCPDSLSVSCDETNQEIRKTHNSRIK